MKYCSRRARLILSVKWFTTVNTSLLPRETCGMAERLRAPRLQCISFYASADSSRLCHSSSASHQILCQCASTSHAPCLGLAGRDYRQAHIKTTFRVLYPTLFSGIPQLRHSLYRNISCRPWRSQNMERTLKQHRIPMKMTYLTSMVGITLVSGCEEQY